MTTEITNQDDLEALLSDLEGLDDDQLLEELGLSDSDLKAEAPKSEPAPEVSDLDEALLESLDELDAPASAVEPVAEAPVEPTKPRRSRKPKADEQPAAEPVAEAHAAVDEPMFTEDELAEAEALLAASPSPAAMMHHTPAFKPSSSVLKLFIEPAQLEKDLAFTTANISTAMTRQASLFAHYATLAAQAQFQADRCKQQVDLIEAELDQAYRDAYSSAGTKVTEGVIKSAITKDSRYQNALTKSHEAKAIAEMVRVAADSFKHRRDMLVQVGADLREEMKGGPVTREREHPGKAALAALQARG